MKWPFGAEPMPDREQARVAEPLVDDPEELLLVADAAVGQEHDLAHEPVVVAASRARPRARRPSPSRRSPAGPRPTPRPAPGSSGVAGRGTSNSDLGRRVELDHVEAIAGAQPVDGEPERLPGLLDRERPASSRRCRSRRRPRAAGATASTSRAHRREERHERVGRAPALLAKTAPRGIVPGRGVQTSSKSRSAGTSSSRSRTWYRLSSRRSDTIA